MSSRIIHGILTPLVPCCDPDCPICGRHKGVSEPAGDGRAFSDPDDDEEDEDDLDDDWSDEDENAPDYWDDDYEDND